MNETTAFILSHAIDTERMLVTTDRVVSTMHENAEADWQTIAKAERRIHELEKESAAKLAHIDSLESQAYTLQVGLNYWRTLAVDRAEEITRLMNERQESDHNPLAARPPGSRGRNTIRMGMD